MIVDCTTNLQKPKMLLITNGNHHECMAIQCLRLTPLFLDFSVNIPHSISHKFLHQLRAVKNFY
jgi:hypothetical protein